MHELQSHNVDRFSYKNISGGPMELHNSHMTITHCCIPVAQLSHTGHAMIVQQRVIVAQW